MCYFKSYYVSVIYTNKISFNWNQFINPNVEKLNKVINLFLNIGTFFRFLLNKQFNFITFNAQFENFSFIKPIENIYIFSIHLGLRYFRDSVKREKNYRQFIQFIELTVIRA